jgi:hypothetical protein
MAFITFSELLPDARQGLQNDRGLVAIVSASAVAMLLFHVSGLV